MDGGYKGGLSSSTPVVLAFSGNITSDFSPNSNGSTFLAHVRYNNCSGFVCDAPANAGSISSGTCSSSVPEPSQYSFSVLV